METSAKRFGAGIVLCLGAGLGFAAAGSRDNPLSAVPRSWGLQSNCKPAGPAKLNFNLDIFFVVDVTLDFGTYTDGKLCSYLITIPDNIVKVSATGTKQSKDDRGQPISEETTKEIALNDPATPTSVIERDIAGTIVVLRSTDDIRWKNIEFSYSPRLQRIDFGLYLFSVSWGHVHSSDEFSEDISEIGGRIRGALYETALQNALSNSIVVSREREFALKPDNSELLTLTFFQPTREVGPLAIGSVLAAAFGILLVFMAFAL
jgi:hypothetical protein